MCRGAGNFWWKRLTNRQLQEIFVCKQHQKELCNSWHNFVDFEHIHRRADDRKYCEVSSIDFPNVSCNERSTYADTRILRKEMAKKLLLHKHVLYHFGIRMLKVLNFFY